MTSGTGGSTPPAHYFRIFADISSRSTEVTASQPSSFIAAFSIAVSPQYSDRLQGSPLAPGRTWALKEAQRSSRASARRSPSR